MMQARDVAHHVKEEKGSKCPAEKSSGVQSLQHLQCQTACLICSHVNSSMTLQKCECFISKVYLKHSQAPSAENKLSNKTLFCSCFACSLEAVHNMLYILYIHNCMNI